MSLGFWTIVCLLFVGEDDPDSGSAKAENQEWSGKAVEKRHFESANGNIWLLACSRNAKVLATGHRDGSIELWDLASGTKTRSLAKRKNHNNGLALSPDGKHLAASFYGSGGEPSNVSTFKPARQPLPFRRCGGGA